MDNVIDFSAKKDERNKLTKAREGYEAGRAEYYTFLKNLLGITDEQLQEYTIAIYNQGDTIPADLQAILSMESEVNIPDNFFFPGGTVECDHAIAYKTLKNGIARFLDNNYAKNMLNSNECIHNRDVASDCITCGEAYLTAVIMDIEQDIHAPYSVTGPTRLGPPEEVE